MSGYFDDLLGTLRSSFRLGRAALSSSALTADRAITIPDFAGTLVVNSDGRIYRTMGIVVDGAGTPLTTGLKGFLVAGFSGTVTGWDIVADQSGSAVFEIWKVATGSIPNSGDKISASAGPSLSSQQVASSSSVPTWSSTAITKGDVVAFNIASVSTITRVTASLRITGT